MKKYSNIPLKERRRRYGMKKIIGYILLSLFFIFLYVEETLLFILGDCHWAVIAFAPLGTFVGAALIVGFMALIEQLID